MLVVTVKVPVVAVQVTVKAAVTVPPDGTVTVTGFDPLTAQLVARPERATSWFPAGRPANVTLPFVPIA